MSKITIERISRIVRLIRRRGSASMRLLREDTEVSEATIKRDIDFLRDRLGCPLEWDSRVRGWVIRDELAEGGRFELPGVWFDASEAVALLTMLHLIEGMQPGLFDEYISPLNKRLRSVLSKGTSSKRPIENKLKLIHFAPRRVEAKHFRKIATALLEEKRLRLQHWNRARQESTNRIVSPQQLVHYRENWFLDAWCHSRNALRSFSLDAIEEVEILDESAVEVSAQEMRDHFQGGYGIFAGPATKRARVKFTPARAQWVSREVWHHSQTSQFLEDGGYVLEVPYSSDQELIMDLLRHCPEVEVLDPPELREKLHTTLHLAAEKNSPPETK